MKKNYLMVGALTGTLLLAGCSLTINGPGKSTEDSNKTSQSDSKGSDKSNSEESKKTDNNSKSNENSNKESKNNNTDNEVQNLSQAEKLALALEDGAISDYAITADELRNHSYTTKSFDGDRQHHIDTYYMEHLGAGIEGAPSDMKFYNGRPAKGNFSTLVGIGNDKILIAGTQSPGDYQSFVNSQAGNELDIHDLYEKYGNNSDYKEIAKQISFSQAPQTNEAEDEDTDQSSSESSGEKVTRANVIDKVEDYEGHKLDTSTYTYKEPEQKSNGDWGFSFVDKNGDLAGSYIVTADGDVMKYDENGDPE